MQAFVALRNFLTTQTTPPRELEDLKNRIEDMEDYNRIHDTAIADLYSSLTALTEKIKPKKSHNPVGYIKPKEKE